MPFNLSALLFVVLLFAVLSAFVAHVIRTSTLVADDADDRDDSMTEPDAATWYSIEFKLTCACGGHVMASSTLGGRELHCPKCKRPLRIPKVA